MDEVRLTDPVARRLARFFADLMVTLAEDGVAGAESAEAIGTLWQTRTSAGGLARLELDAEIVVHGLGTVASALADEVVVARRAAGVTNVTLTDVWREVLTAVEWDRLDDTGAGDGSSTCRDLPTVT